MSPPSTSPPAATVDPQPWDNLVVWFLAQFHQPADLTFGLTLHEVSHEPVATFLAATGGSWCEIDHNTDGGHHQLREAGPTPLWRHIEDAHQLWAGAGRPGWERLNLGGVYDRIGQTQQALHFYEQALPISREVGDRAGEAATLNNLGGVYDRLGQTQQALHFYEQALPISREVGDRAGEAGTRYNLAMVYRGRGEWDRAVAELELVVDLDRQVEHLDLASDTALLEQVRQERAHSDPGSPGP